MARSSAAWERRSTHVVDETDVSWGELQGGFDKRTTSPRQSTRSGAAGPKRTAVPGALGSAPASAHGKNVNCARRVAGVTARSENDGPGPAARSGPGPRSYILEVIRTRG